MKKKTIIKVVATAAVAAFAAVAIAGCGSSQQAVKISVPSDPTNEARALLLLQDQGLIKLKDGAGLAATKNDIAENPKNIELVEVEAAAVPSTLQDVDFGVVNGNYAIGAGIDTATALAREDASSEAAEKYANVIAVRNGEESSDKTRALVAALSTQKVHDFIESTYSGSVIPVADVVSDDAIPAATGEDTTIRVGASPAPHADILAQAKDLLAAKGWTLDVVEFSDYIQPNVALTEGDLDANYFQHIAYLDDYNAQNGTDLVSAALIHFEPLGLYPGKTSSLDALK